MDKYYQRKIIIYVVYKLPKDSKVVGTVNVKYWVIIAGITISIIVIRLLSGFDFKQYGNLIVTGIFAGLISLTLTPWLIKTKK